MKKKEQPKPKAKEFSASPFQALKGKALDMGKQGAAPAPAPKQAKPGQPAKQAKPVTKKELEDELLFLDAVAGVRPLHPKAAAPARAKEQAAARAERAEEEERIFLQAVEALKMDVRFSDSLAEEETPQRPAPVNRLRQVRRGSLRIDLELDLHGLTREEAIENLERFVKAAYNRRQKGVLVITGKGNNSPGEPVLKAAVAAWLRDAGKGMVSEFVQAPKEMGGGGAVVVFLKEKKEQEAAEEK
jgi:DNA-nicking Smr family endonuclease